MKIFYLYTYPFLSQHVVKLLKQIMIFWFTPESDMVEPKYIYL